MSIPPPHLTVRAGRPGGALARIPLFLTPLFRSPRLSFPWQVTHPLDALIVNLIKGFIDDDYLTRKLHKLCKAPRPTFLFSPSLLLFLSLFLPPC